MNIQKIRLVGGIAMTELEVYGKRSPYTGAWNLILEDGNDTHYALKCLVPGRPDTLAGAAGVTGDWSRNQYVLSMEKNFPEGDDLKTLPLSQDDAREIRAILKEVQEGKRPLLNSYNAEVPKSYSDQVTGFLEPRVEIGVKHYVPGKTFAPYREIEQELRPPSDIPPVPRV